MVEFGVEIVDAEGARPCGWQLFVQVYERPTEKIDVGGGNNLEVIEDSLKQDKYMSNVGKVLSMAPQCYTGKNYEGFEPWCAVGDWIIFRAGAGTDNLFKGIPVRLMNDDNCLAIVEDPRFITRN